MRLTLKPSILIFIALLVLALLGGIGYLMNAVYWHPQDKPWIRSLITNAHLPVGRVGSNFIPYADYLIQQEATRRFLASPAAAEAAVPTGQALPKTLDTQAKQVILDQLIRVAAVQVLAQEGKIELTSDDVNRSFDDLISRAGTSTNPGEIDAYLQDTFGWTRMDFKEYVVRPATLETAVRQEIYKNEEAAFQSALDEKTKQAVIYIRL